MEGLRPLSVGELLDASIRIYRGRWKTLLAAVALPVVPVLVFTALVSWSTRPELGVDPSTGAPTLDGGDLALQITGLLVTTIASLVASSIATAACFRAISGAYVGDEPDWRESLRFAMSRIWRVLGVTFLATGATLLGALVCGVGALYPLAFFAVAMPAMLVEGLRPGQAMGRSRSLVTGLGWRTLGIVLLQILLTAAFQLVLAAPLAALLFADVGPAVEQLLNTTVTIVSTIIVTPFAAALTMALYVDLRVRKEGFDLVLWAQRVGASPEGGFPTQPGASAWDPPAPVWGPQGGYGPAGGPGAGGY